MTCTTCNDTRILPGFPDELGGDIVTHAECPDCSERAVMPNKVARHAETLQNRCEGRLRASTGDFIDGAKAVQQYTYVGRHGERNWQRHIVEMATGLGWSLIYHTFESRGSQRGYPDLHMVRVPRSIFVELKTNKGRIRPDQQVWLDALQACGQEAYLWRPRDEDEAMEILR